jgi:hypothetical protein
MVRLDFVINYGGVNSTDGISNFFFVIKITIIATTTPPIQEGISA